MGDVLLASAVLSEYHYAHVGDGYQLYPVHDFLKGGTFTGEHEHPAVSRLPLLLYGADKGDEFVLYQFLWNIVCRTELHAFHGGMHFGVVGHYDERLHHPLLAHPAQQVYSVSVRQTQV